MHVQVKAAARSQGQSYASRAGVQLPGAFDAAIDDQLAAPAACPQTAADATNPYCARTCMHVDVAAAGKVSLNTSAASAGEARSRHRVGSDAAAAGLQARLRA